MYHIKPVCWELGPAVQSILTWACYHNLLLFKSLRVGMKPESVKFHRLNKGVNNTQ